MTPFNIFPEKRNYYIYELESFRTSKTDRHSLRQKVRQRISVMLRQSRLAQFYRDFHAKALLLVIPTEVLLGANK